MGKKHVMIICIITFTCKWFLTFQRFFLKFNKKVKVPGSQISEYWVLSPRSRDLGLGFWVPDPGSRVLDPRSWLLGSVSWVLGPNVGFQVLGPKSWVVGPKPWVLFQIPFLDKYLQRITVKLKLVFISPLVLLLCKLLLYFILVTYNFGQVTISRNFFFLELFELMASLWMKTLFFSLELVNAVNFTCKRILFFSLFRSDIGAP